MPLNSDAATLARQIGRTPRGLVTVAARCPAGHPCVMETYPLRHVARRLAPFPTLYWLTCPRLQAAVANLERLGVIQHLRQLLEADPALRLALQHDHHNYIRLRWNALTSQDQCLIEARPALHRLFQTRGIGGASHPHAVKCLHMHLAHQLASANTLGQWLIEQHGLHPCR